MKRFVMDILFNHYLENYFDEKTINKCHRENNLMVKRKVFHASPPPRFFRYQDLYQREYFWKLAEVVNKDTKYVMAFYNLLRIVYIISLHL